MAKTRTKRQTNTRRPVLVTTAHRGVFFGYAEDISQSTIQLTGCRNCLYWSADMKGFAGLASMGPSATCRIGPAVDLILRDVTAVVDVTPAAEALWLSARSTW